MEADAGNSHGSATDYREVRTAAENRPWRTDTPSPDYIQDALEAVGVPTDRYDYVVLTARDDGCSVKFLGDETREVPVERSSLRGAVRGFVTRRYGAKALRPGERPFIPSENVLGPYSDEVRLLDEDIRELEEEFRENIQEHGGGLQKTYLMD